MKEALEVLEGIERLSNYVRVMSDALLAISQIAGNLPDNRLTSRTGPNDAVARGLMIVHARRIAIEALAKARGE